MGICDLPVISGVYETAGEAAASLVSSPFDGLARAMGSASGWFFDAASKPCGTSSTSAPWSTSSATELCRSATCCSASQCA